MSYPGGYQQQQPQQPQGGYQPQQGGYQPPQQQQAGGYPSGGYSEPDNGTSPTLAIIAAVFALAALASLLVVNFKRLGDVPDGVGFGDFPGPYKTVVILWFGAAVVLLIGAILMFVRKLAGAFITVVGGLAGIAAVLLYPVILGDAFGVELPMGDYLEAIFKFDETEAIFSATALIASVLALILAILPPSLNYLKGSSASSSGYDGYQQPQQPQQPGW